MAKVTWLGEDELHGGGAGPSFVVWNGVKFPKGQAVEVSNPVALAKAKGNKFFKVEGMPAEVLKTPAPTSQPTPRNDDESLTHHERAAMHPRQRTRHAKDDE